MYVKNKLNIQTRITPQKRYWPDIPQDDRREYQLMVIEIIQIRPVEAFDIIFSLICLLFFEIL